MELLFVKAAPSAVTRVTFNGEIELSLADARALLIPQQRHRVVHIIHRADEQDREQARKKHRPKIIYLS